MSSIRRGSEGAEVRTIQEELRSLSYLDDPPDGIFGPRTDAAVRMFQTDHDLVVDGIVGPQTRAALDEALESRPSRPGREEADEGRTEGARPKPGKRPTEKQSAKRPTVRPGKKRPTVRPGKKRPTVSPGGKRKRPAGAGKGKPAQLELHAVGSGADEASIFTAVVRPEGSNDGHAEKFSAARARFTGLPAGTYRVSIDTKADTFLSPEPRSFPVSLRAGQEKKVDIRF